MKELEGKVVYLRPTGNAARRWDKEPIKAKIIKVSRVFLTLILDGSRYESKYRFNRRRLESDFNSGYIVYDSKPDALAVEEVNRLARLITDKYRYPNNYEELNLETIRNVCQLLEIQHEVLK